MRLDGRCLRQTPTWRALLAVTPLFVRIIDIYSEGFVCGFYFTVSEESGDVAVGGHGAQGHFLDGFVDGVDPVLCFFCAGHFTDTVPLVRDFKY